MIGEVSAWNARLVDNKKSIVCEEEVVCDSPGQDSIIGATILFGRDGGIDWLRKEAFFGVSLRFKQGRSWSCRNYRNAPSDEPQFNIRGKSI